MAEQACWDIRYQHHFIFIEKKSSIWVKYGIFIRELLNHLLIKKMILYLEVLYCTYAKETKEYCNQDTEF